MSDAKVTFETVNLDPSTGGDEGYFEFQCPKHDRRCGALAIAGRTGIRRDPRGTNGGQAQWDWDGNRDAPTFSPSVDCKGCWHGYIRNGRCVAVDGTDEP
jgi:hypothetical protein